MINEQERTEMKTLASCMNSLHASGFKENFVVDEKGFHAVDSEKLYRPEELKIVNFYRFEGDSDPADSAILYAIETNDGIKGTLSDAYGPQGDGKVVKFIGNVEEIMKKTDRDTKI